MRYACIPELLEAPAFTSGILLFGAMFGIYANDVEGLQRMLNLRLKIWQLLMWSLSIDRLLLVHYASRWVVLWMLETFIELGRDAIILYVCLAEEAGQYTHHSKAFCFLPAGQIKSQHSLPLVDTAQDKWYTSQNRQHYAKVATER